MCSLLRKITSPVLLSGIVVLLAAVSESIVLETPTILNHITKLNGGRLAVGAVNHVYVVDRDLSVLQNVSTGPVIDSKDCSPSSCETGIMTDNYNKILAVLNDTLITCGNVRQGTCEIRGIHNISDYTADRKIGTMVAASTPEASTVAVVIPGKDAICVGVTYTDGRIRTTGNVPAVSTRPIAGLQFNLARINLPNTDKPIILSYEYGFHMGNYTYFLLSLPSIGKRSSNIARICDNDATYYSYIEIPMECGSTIYNVVQSATIAKLGNDLASAGGVSVEESVLVAVFHKSGVPDMSVICVYRFENITAKINENGNACFQSGGFTNAAAYRESKTCVTTNRDYSTISCGELARNLNYLTNTPVVGTIPVSPHLTIEVGAELSSIAIKTVENHTVVYAGTTDGVLKKIHVKSATEKITFKNLTLGDGRVMEDMIFDNATKNIYVMSGKRLHKVPTYECERFTSCTECVAARDPHCGWCTLENKCSLSSECEAVGVSKKWYYYDADSSQCIVFSKIEPTDRLSTGAEAISLDLTIPHLPEDNTFTCVFGVNISSPATKTPFGVSCETPDPKLFDHGSDRNEVPLSLNSSETGILFISKNFTFFTCKALKMCTPCTRSEWSCQWCVFDHKCVHSSDNATCKPGNVTTDVKCPRIDPSTTPVLLPSGHKKEFVLKTKNLPKPMDDQTGYVCKVKVDDVTFTTSASRSVQGDTVTCAGNTQYSYTESVKTKQVDVSLVWNGGFVIDNPHRVSAEMYKCPLLGPECGICHNLTDSYRCAWTTKCVYTPSGVKSPCPFITINKVFPLNTTIEGGSIVTLNGENLGSNSQSVKGAVTLAGVPCEIIDKDYKVSKKIVCETGPTEAPVVGEIKVVVRGVSGKYSSNFVYKNPAIYDVTPKRGPKSGGTRITINGTSLEAGSWVGNTVSLDDVPCDIEERADKKTVCLLHGDEAQRVKANISMRFENNATREKVVMYVFTEDPTISDITPLRAFVAYVYRLLKSLNEFDKVIKHS